MKVHVFAPNVVTGITFYGLEAGQKLVRSRSNYFAYDGQRALSLHRNSVDNRRNMTEILFTLCMAIHVQRNDTCPNRYIKHTCTRASNLQFFLKDPPIFYQEKKNPSSNRKSIFAFEITCILWRRFDVLYLS